MANARPGWFQVLCTGCVLLATARSGLGAQEVRLPERVRQLVVLPLYNQTGEQSMDYIGPGLARFISSELSHTTFIQTAQQQIIFFARASRPGAEAKSQTTESSADSNSNARVNLVVRLHELYQQNYLAWLQSDMMEQARRLQADYLVFGSYTWQDPYEIRGRYQQSGRKLKIRLELMSAASGQRMHIEQSVSVNAVYSQAPGLGREIRAAMSGQDLTSLSIESDPPDMMVFLEESYLGRTPLTANAVPGNYTIRLQKEGFQSLQRSVTIAPRKTEQLLYKSAPLATGARLHVTSTPAGADVYLNMRKLGQTPLDIADLEIGHHRLRISKPGYVDRYKGIELRARSDTELDFTLQAGDSAEFYANPDYVLFDWTRYDFSFYSLIGSLAFYGGYFYFDSRAGQIRESLRTQVESLSIFDVLNQLQSSPAIYAWQYQLYRQNEAQARVYDRYANGSAATGALMIIGAVWFFYQALDQDMQRDHGEINALASDLARKTERGGLQNNQVLSMDPGMRWFLEATPLHRAPVGVGEQVLPENMENWMSPYAAQADRIRWGVELKW
ncbi:MAG: PEGA domain-containing protein [Leptospiraceae bacterium]|nr:PEGA domain-containing protein [Leptospiraceae bacterium]